jgi:hypothetical protein
LVFANSMTGLRSRLRVVGSTVGQSGGTTVGASASKQWVPSFTFQP